MSPRCDCGAHVSALFVRVYGPTEPPEGEADVEACFECVSRREIHAGAATGAANERISPTGVL